MMGGGGGSCGGGSQFQREVPKSKQNKTREL